MKKMTSYILAGVKAEDERVFMARVGELLERNGLMDQLAEGVVISAVVVDEAALIEALQKRYPKRMNIVVTNDNITIDREGRLELGSIEFDMTLYYSTEKAAEEAKYSNGYEFKDDNHPYPGVCHSSTYNIRLDIDFPGIKVLCI